VVTIRVRGSNEELPRNLQTKGRDQEAGGGRIRALGMEKTGFIDCWAEEPGSKEEREEKKFLVLKKHW
jgi:hypothetical protein